MGEGFTFDYTLPALSQKVHPSGMPAPRAYCGGMPGRGTGYGTEN